MDVQMITLVLVVKATALLVLGAVVAGLMRRAPAGARHLVWLATLVAVLALPVSVRVAPLPLPILPAVAPPEAALAPSTASSVERTRTERSAPAPVPAPVAARALPAAADLLLAAWLVVALALVGRLALGALAVRRIVRDARPLDDRWQALLCEAADRLDLDTLPRLVAAPVEMPFACGVLRPTIVLPADAASWPDERRRLVLVHELAHVRRRDLVAHAIGRIACAVYWFHPLVWGAARRLRAEGERACDDLVLACGARASDYAGLLLDVVTSARRGGAPVTAVPMARTRELEGRVLAILDPALRRGRTGRGEAGAVLLGLAVAFALVAAATPVPAGVAQDPVAAPDPPAVEAHVDPGDVELDVDVDDDAPRATVRHTARHQQTHRETPAAADPERRQVLARVLRTDTDASVRRTAAWALAHVTGGPDEAALAAALRGDADAEVREMAAWGLAHAKAAEAAAELAEALRRDASENVRATAAWGLGHRRNADVAALAAAAADRDEDVRQAAIWALGHQRVDKAPPALLDALRDPADDVRLVATWALGEIDDAAAAPALRAAFDAEKDPEVRRALFRTLAIVDGADALLEKALASDDAELRQRAVFLKAGRGMGAWPWPWPWPQPRPLP